MSLLAWVAQSRALLAVSREGSRRAGPVAVLGGAGGPRGGSLWLVRGMKWQVAPAWLECWPFADSVRASGGRLVGTVDGSAALLLCGLCGRPPSGPVDSWLAAHPLAGGR